MNALVALVFGVVLLVGLHKLQGYLWRKNLGRKRFTEPDKPEKH